MKTHTNQFKENISTIGKQLDSKITYELDGVIQTLTSEQLNSITPTYQGAILKSVMKELDLDSNVDIPLGTVLKYQFGVLVDSEYEYLDFGNYVVYSSEKQEDYDSYKIVCYDKMLYSMKQNEDLGITYPISVRNYIKALCTKIGLEFKNANDTFANYDKMINEELYVGQDYTYRDIFDELAQVTASAICLDDEDKVEIRYISKTVVDTIDKHFLKDINVNFGEKYGPVNSIVLSRSSESDNVYLQDEESVTTNGLCEIKIKDNQIMNWNDRSDYLPDILEKLNGLEYYINDFSSTGIAYLDLCDRYNINVFDNTYSCVMLNDELLVTQGLEENVHTDIPEETETDYKKADKTDRKINQAYLIVDKQQQKITSLTQTTETIQDNLQQNYYDKIQTNQLIQTSGEGITNTFSEAGGNNIFRNTGLWFEDSSTSYYIYPSSDLYPSETTFTNGQRAYEYWDGEVNKEYYDKAANLTALLLQNGYLEQKQQVPNGNYTVSFKYKKLIETSENYVLINDVKYTLDSLEDTEFRTGEQDSDGNYITQPLTVTDGYITVRFYSNVKNAIQIYDLMVNAGTVKLAYSQNQNETTTDTVNISKGITITSSNTDTIFKANSDGIRTLNKSNEVLSEFTDKGMKNKQMEVTDEATIVQILFQNVGDQTWLTRL